ncbi:SH3 domain-containing protein [Geobacter pickeringii]|uniref:SH3 domain-containing protein n=1 Tax=Geobacter pickeringii TaxID=345632 RepID=UPI00068DC8DB|nr:SH3 domain-containing protein [Geobacter pickeringii]
MNQSHQRPPFVRMALILSLALTAACTTVAPQSGGEHGGPLAPGVGFEVDAPTTSPPPAVAVPTPAPSPAVEQKPAAAPVPVASRIKQHHKYVNVRPDPSSGKKPVAVLQGGKRVEIIGEEGNWVKIRWSRGKKEHEGWVFKKYVEGHE